MQSKGKNRFIKELIVAVISGLLAAILFCTFKNKSEPSNQDNGTNTEFKSTTNSNF